MKGMKVRPKLSQLSEEKKNNADKNHCVLPLFASYTEHTCFKHTHTHTRTHTECLLCNHNVILNMQHMESLAKFSVHTYNPDFFEMSKAAAI